MEVKVETTRATRGGISGLTSTPDTGKSITHLLLIISQNKTKGIPLSRNNFVKLLRPPADR
jgi:hypothetical protein